MTLSQMTAIAQGWIVDGPPPRQELASDKYRYDVMPPVDPPHVRQRSVNIEELQECVGRERAGEMMRERSR